jgi:hypothetical protein
VTAIARDAPAEPVTLAELKPMLALFAQALAGRAVALREQGRFGAAMARTNATTPIEVALPPRIAAFASARDNRAAYRVAVMRCVLAAHDDAALADALAAASLPWRLAFGALERLRIDAAIERIYAGARADLLRQRALELAQRRRGRRRQPMTRTLDALWRHALGDVSALQDVGSDSDLRRLLQQADTLRGTDASPLDSARVASAICGLLGVRTHRTGRAGVASIGTGDVPALLAATGPASADAQVVHAPTEAKAQRAVIAAAHEHGAAAATGALAHDAVHAITEAKATPPAARRPPRAPAAQRGPASPRVRAIDDSGLPATAHAIDEWDYRQQRLLPAWCTLFERRQDGSDTAFIHHVRRRHAELAQRVHRQLAAWRPEGLQRVHGASDGDEVEIDRVIEAMVDRRAGLVDDYAWYVRRDRALRDVATAFLVDTSASTDFALPDGTMGPPRPAPSAQADAVYLYDLAASAPPPGPPQRRVIDVAKEALALMCDALHALGDCFAVYTFSGHGRTQVDFRVVKPFDEPVSSRTAAALAALRPHGATRTGAAIRHACAHLLRQPQRRRTLIVVTDGYPEDIDYGPEPRDLRYGVEDSAHALREAQATGIDTFCLSIDPAGHDYLRRMCPPQRYMVIGDLAALPGELAKVYQAMTRPAPTSGITR